MEENIPNTEGLFKYKKKSLYKFAERFGEDRKNLGFDYSDSIMEKNVSQHLYRNPKVSTFLIFLNDYFVTLINAVKKIRIHRVYTVDKDYEYIN